MSTLRPENDSTLRPAGRGTDGTDRSVTDNNVSPASDGNTPLVSDDGTLRPSVQGTAPLANDSGDGTLRPSVQGTAPLANDSTFRPANDSTMRPSMPMADDDNDTQNDNYFILKGKKYLNLQCLSDNSGEAQVFLVEKDGEHSVLKIYYPTFNVNKKLLQAVFNFDFEMIVHLKDFGKTYVEGKNRYYELMEYLRGGSLNEYHLNGDMDRFRRIALQGAAALAYCHSNNIIHKDVKPSNFFFRDPERTELVLGDFGISSFVENDGKPHRTTQARTPIYAAPEMYTDVIDGEVEITPAADFYSFGMTLMALWLESSPLSSNERVMMRQKNEGRLPRLNELPERVRMIVQGMTTVNPSSRWGFDEVESWFKGESPKVDLSSPFLKYKSFIVDPDRNLVADNIHELVPMLIDNELLAIGYLYNGRLGSWLESCGNQKLSTIVKDIVVNRYPVDQKAGLMAAVYMMEPTYPYHDVKGAICDDVHSIAISLLSYQDEYGLLLNNPNDSLFLYLETHTKCDVNRLRSYFVHDDKYDARTAILRMVYEIDPEIPFINHCASSNIHDIVSAFGRESLTDDDWHSLCDGRLLSWMYSHEDMMACESLRILTKDQPYSKSLAYKVLYNLDREAAYDLRFAHTALGVGELLRDRLKNAEHLSDDEFAKEMSDFLEPNGRFAYFAQLHGWNEILSEAVRNFNFKSEENRDRLSAYDAKTAVYRFCRILGVTPVYLLPDGSELTDGRNIEARHFGQIRREMSHGSFPQWMSVFYHEDPFADFSEEYSYEHTLESWLMDMGKIDPTQHYYKRFVSARDETTNRIQNVRHDWAKAKGRENIWRWAFYGFCGLWILLVLIFGVENREYLLNHTGMAIGLPVGGMTAIIVATRAYFRGYGFVFSMLWGLLGAMTVFIPILILKYIGQSHSSLFSIAIIVITLVYMLVCHLTDFRGDQKADSKLITEVLDNDIKSSLLEPLYYTFKTKSYRYKGSKFGLIDDVSDQVRSISGESVLHYVLWTILAVLLCAEFIVFSPSLLNMKTPDKERTSVSVTKVIDQLEEDKDK